MLSIVVSISMRNENENEVSIGHRDLKKGFTERLAVTFFLMYSV